jgi:hypothetical protein
MHASLAFVNGAGVADGEQLRLLNTLLSAAGTPDNGRSTGVREADEKTAGTAPVKPDSFKNDPPDPKNPNEERERHLKKIKQ